MNNKFGKLIEKLEQLSNKKVFLKEEPILFKDLEKIAREVIKKYPKINKGGCAQFAIAINKIFGLDKFFLLYETDVSIDYDIPTHVCIDLGNNQIYDPDGVNPKSYLNNSYEGINGDPVIEPTDINGVVEFQNQLRELYGKDLINQKELEDFIKSIVYKRKLTEDNKFIIVNPLPHYDNETKTKELIDKCKQANCMDSLDGISLGKDKKGFFVYTHRWRSKSYNKPESIPIKDIKFCETTG